MNDETRSLIKRLFLQKISKEEFLSIYFKDSIPDEKYFLTFLENASVNKDPMKIEEALIVLNLVDINKEFLSVIFCELIKESWHYQHEQLATLLSDIKNPTTVDCLYEATELQFPYLDYDDTFQFGRKCIKGLSAIGDFSAVNKLRSLAQSKNIKIASYAKKELNYKGLL